MASSLQAPSLQAQLDQANATIQSLQTTNEELKRKTATLARLEQDNAEWKAKHESATTEMKLLKTMIGNTRKRDESSDKDEKLDDDIVECDLSEKEDEQTAERGASSEVVQAPPLKQQKIDMPKKHRMQWGAQTERAQYMYDKLLRSRVIQRLNIQFSERPEGVKTQFWVLIENGQCEVSLSIHCPSSLLNYRFESLCRVHWLHIRDEDADDEKKWPLECLEAQRKKDDRWSELIREYVRDPHDGEINPDCDVAYRAIVKDLVFLRSHVCPLPRRVTRSKL